jgi:hypothetical protein
MTRRHFVAVCSLPIMAAAVPALADPGIESAVLAGPYSTYVDLIPITTTITGVGGSTHYGVKVLLNGTFNSWVHLGTGANIAAGDGGVDGVAIINYYPPMDPGEYMVTTELWTSDMTYEPTGTTYVARDLNFQTIIVE